MKELVADKDSSVNATYCKYFPEGILTFCSNHCAKSMHKHLETVKRNKCEVRNNQGVTLYNLVSYLT